MNGNRHFKWLVFGAASALFLGGCVVPEGEDEVPGSASDVTIDGAQAPIAGDITATLSVDTKTVGASENVVVTIKLTNNAKHPVKVLGMYAPDEELEEDLFSVTVDGSSVEYIGPHYKRPAPQDSDYVTLPGGKFLTRVVDITNFYDLSRTGDYQIKYAASVSSASEKEEVRVESNAVLMWIEAHASPFTAPPFVKAPSSPNVVGTTTFNKCTVTQQNDLITARGAASTMANNSLTYLSGSPADTPRFKTWFGAFSTNNWNQVKTQFNAIKTVYDTQNIKFDCGCKKTYYAYVYPAQPYDIYLCKAFWTAPLTGTDSRGGTIVHETSHFNAVAATNDYAYGHSAAKSLAISNPTNARKNADSHEYFAENTPALQ